jgi:hypothetical protein
MYHEARALAQLGYVTFTGPPVELKAFLLYFGVEFFALMSLFGPVKLMLFWKYGRRFLYV